ncbi:MAG: CYTH domain-containing protein [Elusimicrobia bacterium]|nr:CYTH domain-containing protein [Elusimicrobiota bacterium]
MSKETAAVWSICRRLETTDPRFVEIESKRKVVPEQAKDLRKHLLKLKKVHHDKRVTFYDQYLDTPDLRLLKLGASLRLRYKGDGSNVYLQYKGPGFIAKGLLYRSEFSSEKLEHVVREESHHDVVHFTNTSVREILEEHVSPEMSHAMQRHLGLGVISRISRGPILCAYEKDKFFVDEGPAFLEPSLDHIFAFHVSPSGIHSVSTFWEYENEVKTEGEGLEAKIEHIPELLKFDRGLAKKFDLRPERLDKYHRCASCFLKLSGRRRRRR